MATLYRHDGTKEKISPANGRRFTMKEIRALLGGDAERLPIRQTVFARVNNGQLIRLAMDKGE